MTDYRNLPPVEPVEIPQRFSMTLLDRDDSCPRSAYLSLKHKNGAGSHAMDRGTLLHAVLERAMKTLIAEGEPAIAPEDPEQAASIMAALVDSVLRESPELVVPRAEVDDVRESAFHWATSYDVNPEHVAGLERLMVLDLECGIRVSGRLDLIALPSAELGQVDDYKSGCALPSQDEYERKLQPWVYAALLCYGAPVTRLDCFNCDAAAVDLGGHCPICDGSGYYEECGEPFGKHLRGVLTREVYPHPKPRDDGLLHHRELLLSRTAIADFVADLETKAVRLAERLGTKVERCEACEGTGSFYAPGQMVETDVSEDIVDPGCATCEGRGYHADGTWDFPARSSGGSENGSWCSRCPAPLECPLPATLRNHAGSINTLDEATEAWTWAQHHKAEVAAVEREAKNFARAHDVPIRVGDQEWRWTPREGRALKRAGRGSDWDGLVHALTERAEFGTPFRIEDWVQPTVSNGFVKSKVTEESG